MVAAKGNQALLNVILFLLAIYNIMFQTYISININKYINVNIICNFSMIYENNVSTPEIYTCICLSPGRMFFSISRKDTFNNETQNLQLAVVAVTGPGAI